MTHYRYDGDTAIVTLVNLSQRTLITVEIVAHLPTPLAAQEFSRARELALAQAEVQAALAPYGDRVVAEGLVARAARSRATRNSAPAPKPSTRAPSISAMGMRGAPTHHVGPRTPRRRPQPEGPGFACGSSVAGCGGSAQLLGGFSSARSLALTSSGIPRNSSTRSLICSP